MALKAFTDNPHIFDLVITDQTMPGLNGYELSRAIVALRSDIPIILCSGYNNMNDNKVAAEAGIKSFAPKPWTIKEMALIIENLLKK